MIGGRFAVATGLVGLDCWHECDPELHPLYSLAIRMGSHGSREKWMLFVRNWGNEGSCSSARRARLLARLAPAPADDEEGDLPVSGLARLEPDPSERLELMRPVLSATTLGGRRRGPRGSLRLF